MRTLGWNRKRDANEKAIVDALRQAGAAVMPVSGEGVPDLLVLWRRKVLLLEIKTAKGRATLAQSKTAAAGWPIVTVHTADEALKAVGIEG